MFGNLQAALTGALNGLLPSGLLHTDSSPIYDEGGAITSGGGDDIAIKVQRDVATYAMQQSDGYVDGDVRLIIVSSVYPNTDNEVTDGYGDRWKLMTVESDAVSSHYVCRGRRA